MLQRTAARLACAVCMGLMGSGMARAEEALMSALFTEHGVLQRDRPIEVWGRAGAGEDVTVTLSGNTSNTKADASGHWALTLPALPAGGPHVLTARTPTREQKVADVLVGDVFLCSGQSNMEFAVRGSLNARAEIAASANDRIRQVTIAKTSSTTPRDGVDKPLEWKRAAPETTGDFSATCYYYARELQKTVHVPIGLIVSAWGGSKIEPWMSEDAMRTVPGYEAALAVSSEYRVDPAKAAQHWGDHWQAWWKSQGGAAAGREPWASSDDKTKWSRAPAELTPWESWGVPALSPYDGMVWYRARARLTNAQSKQAATLSLGQIDEVDLTFVNGRAVGSSPCCGERTYALPEGSLRAGENLVVVNVLDTYASGGMYGPAEKRVLVLADGTRITLADWKYSISPDLVPPRAPWEPTAGIGMLYNAMIAPLGKYGLRAALWYQGESNTSVPEGHRYQALLTALMADWRRQFGVKLPFLVVQLANYGPVAKVPVESGWALTREAERRAVAADGNAGLAVTYDIGNRDDVHPTNKQELGRRLARAARKVVYGEQIFPGAEPRSAKREGSRVVVEFAEFEGALTVYHSKDPAAFELCGAAPGSCRFVSAQLNGDRVLLSTEGVADARRVRFCWADSPLCNLYDGAGLPVSPFEIEVKP